jgi:hypothetical protein
MQQDNIGNIYITRCGSDLELASIALGFPLDSIPAEDTFPGAFKVFQEIAEIKTRCSVTLVGWAAPSSCNLGEEVWDGRISTSVGYARAPELKLFSNLEEPSTFPFSALFQIIEEEQLELDSLTAQGSPVITQRLHLVTSLPLKVENGGSLPQRVPFISLRGKSAVSVGKLVVKDYSNYVAALFENFD